MNGGSDDADLRSWLTEEHLDLLPLPSWMGPISARVEGRDIWSTASDLPWMPVYGAFDLDDSIQSALLPGRGDFFMLGAVGGFSALYGKLGPIVAFIQWRSKEMPASFCAHVWNLLAAQATASRAKSTAEALVAFSPPRGGPQVFVRGLDGNVDGHEPRGWMPLVNWKGGERPTADDVMSGVRGEVDATRTSALRALHTLMTESEAWIERKQDEWQRDELARARADLLRAEDEDMEERIAAEVAARMPWAPASMAESGWVRLARYAVAIRGAAHYSHILRYPGGEASCDDHYCVAYRCARAVMDLEGTPLNGWPGANASSGSELDPRSPDMDSAQLLIDDVLSDTTRLNRPFANEYLEVPIGMYVPWFRTWEPQIDRRFENLTATYADFLTELFRFIYPAGYSVDLSLEALRSAGYTIAEPWSRGPDDTW